MKVRFPSVVAASLLALFAAAPMAQAAAVPVQVKVTGIKCVQNYMMDVKAKDQVYGFVTGVAKGAPVEGRLPKDGTLPSLPKEPPLTEATDLWTGELAEGEFALVTFTMFEGADAEKPGDAAPVKALVDGIAAATKGAAGDKKTLTAADATGLAEKVLKAHQEVVTKATNKENGTLGRKLGTDHFNGSFTVLVLNDGGKIVKRLDPVGLTFGDHYGTDLKIYTKLKRTRANVMVKDASGEYFPQMLEPLTEDKSTVLVKMLENEFEKNPKTGRLVKNVTDYLVETQVVTGGKPEAWKLGGEVPSDKSLVHVYWNWAE